MKHTAHREIIPAGRNKDSENIDPFSGVLKIIIGVFFLAAKVVQQNSSNYIN